MNNIIITIIHANYHDHHHHPVISVTSFSWPSSTPKNQTEALETKTQTCDLRNDGGIHHEDVGRCHLKPDDMGPMCFLAETIFLQMEQLGKNI